MGGGATISIPKLIAPKRNVEVSISCGSGKRTTKYLLDIMEPMLRMQPGQETLPVPPELHSAKEVPMSEDYVPEHEVPPHKH